MIPTKRILTRKSTLNFGKYKKYTVQQMLDLRRNRDLISAYYKLTSIDFQDDILRELGIVNEYVIQKPSKDIEMYHKFFEENSYTYPKREQNRQGADVMKKFSRSLTKSQLQRYNHGH